MALVRRSVLAWGLVLAAVACAKGASAQDYVAAVEEGPVEQGSFTESEPSPGRDCGPDCEKPEPRPGTHFIAEANAGATTFGTGGLTLGGLLGVGGKLGSFPPRFYLVGEVAQTRVKDEVREGGGFSFRHERTYLDLGVGPRVYIPVYGPIRVFGDAVFGQSLATTELERSDFGLIEQEGWVRFSQVGVGAQVRLFHSLSIGARARWAWNTGPSIYADDELVSDGRIKRTTLTATLTGHF